MATTTPGRVPATPPPRAAPAAPRPERTKKPSAKVLETQRALQSRTTTTRSSQTEATQPRDDSATASSQHEHGNISLNEIAHLIISLKDTITKQNTTIENIKADLIEIKAEQQNLKTQNSELQEVVRALQSQLSIISTSPPSTRTWASIAASRSGTESDSNLSRPSNPENPNRDLNCLRISTRPNPTVTDSDAATFTRYLPTETANMYIRNALRNTEATKDAEVAGVGTTKTGYVIRFKDQRSTEAAKANTEWLQALSNGTKLVKPRFGVVMHRTPTEEFLLPENEAQGIQKITEENDIVAKGYNIQEIAWLKSKDKELGRSASLGIWFDTAEAAEWAINNGLLVGQRYIGSIEPYQTKKKRCHRCQAIGHLAFACKEQMRCGFCAGEHDRRECLPDATARCVDCSEAHPTGDRDCRGKTITNPTQ